MEKGQGTESLTCPVCGTPNLYSINRQSVTLPQDDPQSIVSGVLGHRCENGHVSIATALHLSSKKRSSTRPKTSAIAAG
jgi:hypothetical protein